MLLGTGEELAVELANGRRMDQKEVWYSYPGDVDIANIVSDGEAFVVVAQRSALQSEMRQIHDLETPWGAAQASDFVEKHGQESNALGHQIFSVEMIPCWQFEFSNREVRSDPDDDDNTETPLHAVFVLHAPESVRAQAVRELEILLRRDLLKALEKTLGRPVHVHTRRRHRSLRHLKQPLLRLRHNVFLLLRRLLLHPSHRPRLQRLKTGSPPSCLARWSCLGSARVVGGRIPGLRLGPGLLVAVPPVTGGTPHGV